MTDENIDGNSTLDKFMANIITKFILQKSLHNYVKFSLVVIYWPYVAYVSILWPMQI